MTTPAMHTDATEPTDRDDVHGFVVPFFFLVMVAAGAGAATGIAIAPTGAEHLVMGRLRGLER